MGCWNNTCGLSNLPILSGNEVYVFPILRDMRVSSLCYSTALYRPFLAPFVAEYDDYGGGENCSGIMLNSIIEVLKSRLVEKPLGKNEYHDVAVTRDGFDVDKFFESINKHRLEVSGFSNSEVYFSMVQKDVVDRLWNEYSFRIFHNFGDSKNKDYRYVTVSFADLFSMVPDYLEECNKFYDPKDHHNMFRSYFRSTGSPLSGFLNEDYYSQSSRFFNLINISALVADVYQVNKDDAIEICRIYLIGILVDAMMSATRKIWTPVMHQGSQNQDYDEYRLMNKITGEIIAACLKEYADEDGDDEKITES